MRKFFFALLLYMSTSASISISEQFSSIQSTIFLSSSPINAQVLHNGTPLTVETPLLLRDLAPGRHSFEVRKEGYATRMVRVELAAGEIRFEVVDLTGGAFQPVFPNDPGLLLAGKPEAAAAVIFQLPEGDYRVRRDGDRLRVDPRYPLQGAITGLNISLPLALAFSGVLTLYDLLRPPEGPLPLSATTLSAYGIKIGRAHV
jgi:hypothetical protein